MRQSKKPEQKNVADILALTPLQEGILYHFRKDPGGLFYVEQLSLTISGPLDRHCFLEAWNKVIETNYMLRAVFLWDNIDKPVQVILKNHAISNDYYDLSAMEPGQKQQRLTVIMENDRQRFGDLKHVPFHVTLCRMEKGETGNNITGEDKYTVVINNHHILFDGWSTGIILDEFFNAYETLRAGNQWHNPVKTGFKEFIKLLQTQEPLEQELFWQTYLGSGETFTELPVKRKKSERSPVQCPVNHRSRLSTELNRKIEEFSRANKLTPAAFFYTAWGVLLQRYSDTGDIVFGTTVSGRDTRVNGIENMVGLFINTLPLRLSDVAGKTIKDAVKDVFYYLHAREAFENTPLVKIKEYVNCSAYRELFDNILVIENYPLENLKQRLNAEKNRTLTIDGFYMQEKTHYDLTVGIGFDLSGQITVDFSFDCEVLEEETVKRMAAHFCRIMEDMVEHPGKTVEQLEFLGDDEKRQLLVDFNDTGADYPHDKTICELFEEQVEKTPDAVAIVGPGFIDFKKGARHQIKKGAGYEKGDRHKKGDRHQIGHQIEFMQVTYGELNHNANALARFLLKKGDRHQKEIVRSSWLAARREEKKKGTRHQNSRQERIVALMMDRGVDQITAILGILKTGAAFMPIDPQYPKDRVDFMLKDSKAVLCLDQSLYMSYMSYSSYKSYPTYPPIVSKASPADLAYIIYTSGSTGKPKGVMVEHRSLTAYVFASMSQWHMARGETKIQQASFTFDKFLDEVFPVLLRGGRMAIVQKHQLLDIEALGDFIDRHNVNIIDCTPLLLNELNRGERIYKSLHTCISAGDVLKSEYVGKFLKTGTVMNNYGPTEATVCITLYKCTGKETGDILIGKPNPNYNVHILDKNNRLLPVGVPGELCASGPGIARGYLNRPEKTAEKFVLAHSSWLIAHRKEKELAHSSWLIARREEKEKKLTGTNEPSFPMSYELRATSCLYKTGDLARWLADGNIEFLGRMDQQVKIRGYRIELEEIENLLLGHDRVSEAVVAAREEKPGDKSLCGYVVPVDGGSGDFTEFGKELKEYLALRLPVYMVPAHMVEIDKLPLTRHGKIDREQLPAPQITAGKRAAPVTDLEKTLTAIWADVLGIDQSAIGVEANFFELGGHSLKSTAMVARVQKKLKVKIPLGVLFGKPTIRTLAQYIAEEGSEKQAVKIEPVEKKEYYILSSAQKRHYVIQQMEPQSSLYNVPKVLRLKDRPGEEKLNRVFQELTRRHESFRTSFRVLDDEPVQVVHDRVDFRVEVIEAREPRVDVPSYVNRFIRPFDLSRAPLLRAALLRTHGAGDDFLLMDIHHVIFDEVSYHILMRDFHALYRDEQLPPPPVLQYKDYACWQNRADVRTMQEKNGAYWLDQFKDGLPVLNLQTDFPRPSKPSIAGARVIRSMDETDTAKLKTLALESNVTLFMLMLAIADVLFSKWCHQEDIVVGAPSSDRLGIELENIVGMFVNTLILRNRVDGDSPFKEFLEQVKKNTLEAFEHRDYQYDDLLTELRKTRDVNGSGLFNVLFNLEDMEAGDAEEIDYIGNYGAAFDLTFSVIRMAGKIHLVADYPEELFKRETIEQKLEHYTEIVTHILTDPSITPDNIHLSHDKILGTTEFTEDDYF